MGHLFGLQHTTPASFAPTLKAFAQDLSQMQVVDTPTAHETRFNGSFTTAARGQACRPQRPAREPWRISSYSHLPIGGQRTQTAPELDDTARAENWLESRREHRPSESGPLAGHGAASSHPMHRFPKGAHPGTFLHDLMEWCANAGFNTVLDSPDELRHMIQQRCATHRWETWVEPLYDWVQQLLITPLPAGEQSIRLNAVTTSKAEMEFWLETRHLDLQALDHAVIQHTLDGRARPVLSPDSLTGMLKGFMDLVLEHEGRYYVVDYKSNWLGSHDAAYTAESMEAVIRANRYDLQYVLYLFAVHRLLRSRLPNYDYDRHMGGAIYLFLRGIASPSAGVHFERPPKALMDQLDRLFTGRAGDIT
jgi:exodeoxyribonuclease V beta subunit